MNPTAPSLASLAPLAVAAWALAYAGMAALCAAMDRHGAQLCGREPHGLARAALRTSGALLLALALLPSVHAWGPTVGVVAWLGWLSAGALLLVLLLDWAPRAAGRLALAAPVAAALCGVWA